MDSLGNIHARYEYDPYGQITKLSGDVDSDFLYTGHYYHFPSKLFLAEYRVYDPNFGRWLSRDLLAEKAGSNLYKYCINNPLNYIDKNGLAPTKIPEPQGGPPVPPKKGGKWTLSPDPENGIGGTYTAPGGENASWDPEGHWDVDNGEGNRERYDWRGNPIPPGNSAQSE